MSTATVTEPMAWIGSLAAYNAGHLIGDWYPATEAADVTVADLHRGTGVPFTDDDELWVLDLDGDWPVRREMDPCEAQRWGDLYTEVGDSQWPALCAWVRSGAYIEGGDGMPSVADFTECFAGHWSSFQDYAEDLAEDCGLLRDIPEELVSYVDLSRWASDIESDYTTTDAPTGGVYVFRDL